MSHGRVTLSRLLAPTRRAATVPAVAAARSSTKAIADAPARAGRGGRPAADLGAVRPVQPARLADDVTEQLRTLIVEENLQVGTRLPSERALAQLFGASRPVVSQAVRTLSLMGLVEVRPGSGAYVVRRTTESLAASVTLMLDLDPPSVAHLADLRTWLETLGATQALRTGAVPDVTELRTALVRLAEATGNTSAWIAADTVFHAGVVRQSGNPFLTSVYESVHTAVLSYEYERWVRRQTTPTWLRASQADEQLALHAPIVDALEGADLPGLLAALDRHHQVMLQHLRARR